jgi:hypothetical protein
MTLRFLGKDPDSPQGGSPSLWDLDEGYVIQGSQVTDPEVVAELLRAAGQDEVPAHETLVKFPKRLMSLFPEVSG